MARRLYAVLKPIDSIGAQPGDFLVVRPGELHQYLLTRRLNPSVESILSDVSAVSLEFTTGKEPPPGDCALRLLG